MSRLTESRAQRLNVAQPQLDIRSNSANAASPLADDFEEKMEAAKRELEVLQRQQEEIAAKEKELKELNERKEEFLRGQNDISDRLTTSLTAIDRELYELKQDIEALEETRQCFAEHQQVIDGLDPQKWSRDKLKEELDQSIAKLDHAEDEYEEAMLHFANSRRANLFTTPTAKPGKISGPPSAFMSNFTQGLAFNLPLILVAAVGYAIYLAR